MERGNWDDLIYTEKLIIIIIINIIVLYKNLRQIPILVKN